MTTHQPHRAGASALELWAQRLNDIEELDLRRTSNKSKRDFEAMLDRGAAGRPDDPDAQKLASYGHQIVLPSGESLRRSLGAFTITRGSVDGTRSRAVLGWAVPIGRTLFILYLESARKFDIEGPTPDDGANAFAEAVRGLIRATRPARLHTPLLSRVFRLVDHAIPLMRTLRTYGVRLYAEGRPVPLDGDDAKFMATIQAAMMDKDAAQTVARLEGDRLNIYGRGEWFLGRKLLPFTWDTTWELVEDPLTGVAVRRDTDKHTLMVTERGPELLRLMVRLGSTPGVGRYDIAMELGRQGVVSRAPKYARHPRTLDTLRQPRTAIDSLITPQWIAAFRTGWYEDSVEFTSDLRSAYPAAPMRVDQDGRKWLTIRVRMPAPEEGWGISDAEWDDFEALQLGPEVRRRRATSKAGRVRPLLGLCTFTDDKRQATVLGFESSGYQLCDRPSELAQGADGSSRAWGREATWQTTLNCRAWHMSIAASLVAAGLELADQVAPLVPAITAQVTADRHRPTHELEEVQHQIERLERRIRGIREERQETRGDASLNDQRRRSRVAALNEDEVRAEVELEEAAARHEHLSRRATESPAAVEHRREERAEADFATLEAVIAGLSRYPGTAPRELGDALSRLLGNSLRWQVIQHGTTVAWTAEVTLPLRDGDAATRTIAGTVPVSKGIARPTLIKANSERQKRLPQRSAAPPGPSAETYARRFFLDGASLLDIESERGMQPHGGSSSPVYRLLRTWLLERGVISMDLARAALDMPILRSRQALFRGLTGEGGRADQFDELVIDVYLRGIPLPEPHVMRQTAWGVLWCAAAMHSERRVFQILKEQAVPGSPMSAARLADLADVPYTTAGGLAVGRGASIIQIVNGGRERRAEGCALTALPRFLIKDWDQRDRRPPESKTVALRPCPHRSCRGHLQPVPVPEVPGMMLCDGCRRLPSNDRVVFPREYLLPWSGGRRERRASEGIHVGTVLAT